MKTCLCLLFILALNTTLVLFKLSQDEECMHICISIVHYSNFNSVKASQVKDDTLSECYIVCLLVQ